MLRIGEIRCICPVMQSAVQRAKGPCHGDQNSLNSPKAPHQEDHKKQKQQHPVLRIGVDEVVHRVHVVAGGRDRHGKKQDDEKMPDRENARRRDALLSFVPESIHQHAPGENDPDLIDHAVQCPVVIDPKREDRDHGGHGEDGCRRGHAPAKDLKYCGCFIPSGFPVIQQRNAHCCQHGKENASHEKEGGHLWERDPVGESCCHGDAVDARVMIKPRLIPDRILPVRYGRRFISRAEHRIIVGIEDVDIGVPRHRVDIDGERDKALLLRELLLLLCKVLQGSIALDMEEAERHAPLLFHLLDPGLQDVQMAVLCGEVVPRIVVRIHWI